MQSSFVKTQRSKPRTEEWGRKDESKKKQKKDFSKQRQQKRGESWED